MNLPAVSFDSCVQRICREYSKIDEKLGWQFLYTPRATLSKKTNLVFLGLNPRGTPDFKGSVESCEAGNAYRVERWAKGHLDRNFLQEQVCSFFELIAESDRNTPSVNKLMDESLTANFCPYTSRKWVDLAANEDCLSFCRDMWEGILEHVRPKVLVTMGRETSRQITMTFPSQGRLICEESTGWGDIKYRLEKITNGPSELLHISLPHLSRFRIFRPAHADKFKRLVQEYTLTSQGG